MEKKNEENITKVNLRVDAIVLIIQFLTLLVGIVWSYADLSNKTETVSQMLNMHIKTASEYVREDVWKTRNTFIDDKLNSIERKLDLLILQRSDLTQDNRLVKKDNSNEPTVHNNSPQPDGGRKGSKLGCDPPIPCGDPWLAGLRLPLWN